MFNLLCMPGTIRIGAWTGSQISSEAQAVVTEAVKYCQKHRAFFLMDAFRGMEDSNDVERWFGAANFLRHPNAAFYHPRVVIPNPLNHDRPRPVGASGTIAGIYARTDESRGVWKAPTGPDAALKNVLELERPSTYQDSERLDPMAVNCLRHFPEYGYVVWGGRTLAGADHLVSQWKYVSVRRLSLFIEESLYRGTQWVVFEPNDEPLWAKLRQSAGAFMHNLFRQGAFAGADPDEAFLVKCDKKTTTQDEINRGFVNVLVGFAPLRPAEFVFINIRQSSGR